MINYGVRTSCRSISLLTASKPPSTCSLPFLVHLGRGVDRQRWLVVDVRDRVGLRVNKATEAPIELAIPAYPLRPRGKWPLRSRRDDADVTCHVCRTVPIMRRPLETFHEGGPMRGGDSQTSGAKSDDDQRVVVVYLSESQGPYGQVFLLQSIRLLTTAEGTPISRSLGITR